MEIVPTQGAGKLIQLLSTIIILQGLGMLEILTNGHAACDQVAGLPQEAPPPIREQYLNSVDPLTGTHTQRVSYAGTGAKLR